MVEKATKKKLVMKKLISRGMNEAEKKMAKNEIQVLKKCVHENIVRYIDDFYEKGEIFFLMEFCPGRRLVLVKFIIKLFFELKKSLKNFNKTFLGGDLAKAIEKQSETGELFSVDRVEIWTGKTNCASLQRNNQFFLII